jgi:hypothetical protein
LAQWRYAVRALARFMAFPEEIGHVLEEIVDEAHAGLQEFMDSVFSSQATPIYMALLVERNMVVRADTRI